MKDMIITRVKLENFGLYAGVQEFNFKTTAQRNIILIGGQNGNGKTTLFEAIRFCFYGPAIFHKRLTSKEYEDYLKSKIYYNVKKEVCANNASIEIEFEYVHLGKLQKYCINRSWKLENDQINEVFNVKRDGEQLDEVESDQWQVFISDLIPPGLSELFFFDGEKIQNLANDTPDNIQLSDSFKSLLGIDLIEKLQSDLEIYLLKQLKQSSTKEIRSEMEGLEKKEQEYELKQDYLNQEIAQINTKLDAMNQKMNHQEALLNSEGGSFTQKRNELRNRGDILDREIEYLENEIRKLCEDILPLSFTPKLSLRLKKSIETEDQVRSQIQAGKSIQKGIEKIKRELNKEEAFFEIDNINLKKKLIEKIIRLLENNLASEVKEIKFTHNLAAEEENKILNLIESATNTTPKQLIELTKKYEAAVQERQMVEREIGLAAPNSTIENHLKDITQLNQEIGSNKQKLNDKNEELRLLLIQKEKNARELKKFIEKIETEDSINKRTKLVSKVHNVLKDYYEQVKEKKIHIFCELFIESYEKVARKKNVFSRITLNPETYEVKLYKKGKSYEKEVKKSELSEGEKQIYAITVLWTLTKMSPKQLPFIIDTPLGRLDIPHRENIVLNFFPKVSHQLIILSTDTEIDEKYYKNLKSRINKNYILDYSDGETQIKEGYFWG